MAGADKKGHQVAGNRGGGGAGKPRKVREGGNSPDTDTQTQSGSRKKRGASVASPKPLCPNGAGSRHQRAEREGGERNGRRGGAPLLAQSHATNPQRGQKRPKRAHGGRVAPPMVEPMNK